MNHDKIIKQINQIMTELHELKGNIQPDPECFTEDNILKAVCKHFKCTKDELRGLSRQGGLSDARKIWGILLFRNVTDNYKTIASKMNRKAKSSTYEFIDVAIAQIESNKPFRNHLTAIELILKKS